MAEIGYSIASKLIEVLSQEIIKNICTSWNYESQLERLIQTVSTVKQVFLDADAKWDQLSHQDKDFIKKLKDAVYDAEDVFDEFHTRAMLNQLGKKRSKVSKLFEKLNSIFSSDLHENKVYYAHRVSRDVRNIMERLDAISSNHNKFNLRVDNTAILRRPQETISHVNVDRIVGRDEDKEKIISALLDPREEENFYIFSIVGMGGLGKTTLAKLVFNDEKIKKQFSNRWWVSVSDQEGKNFDVESILRKILELTKVVLGNNSSWEYVQREFQENIRGKRYLLVLDDLWNEDHKKWIDLEDFLRMGHRGSRIIVTTRSEETTKIIDSNYVYRLQGLSTEDSKRLFEMSAFKQGEKIDELGIIGENITRKCHRNPLAITVLGSLLYGQCLSEWKKIEKTEWTEISKGTDQILPILKLSYYNLSPSLKSCFSYCSIFPKDYQIKKEMLIGVWMAQGYVVEDNAEEYFSILMRRCFFQDVVKDKYDNVVSIQIHDLMHDVAQEVVKEEICVVGGGKITLSEKVRHINARFGCVDISKCSHKLRSYIGHRDEHLCKNLRALRVLMDLTYCGITSLPRELLLLRYLNLNGNWRLKELPDSITGLYNLQTLILRNCRNLRKVPNDFSNLINLRHLDLYGCDGLKAMPLGILRLKGLRVLPYFVEWKNEISCEEFQVLQQVFTNLEGKICIEPSNEMNDNETRDSKSMKPIAKVTLSKYEMHMSEYKGEWVIYEGVLEKLELPTYLNEFYLSDYKGTTIPWSTLSSLQNLQYVNIVRCINVEQISILSELPKLKSLGLYRLERVEYMEDRMSSNSNDTNAVSEFFPSLEHLEIFCLSNLKAWWKGDFPGMRLRFPRLSELKIRGCPNFTSFAPCSNSEYLTELQLPSLGTSLIIKGCPSLATNLICPPTIDKLILKETSKKLQITDELVNVKEMRIDKVDQLNFITPSNCLTSLRITGDVVVESVLERVHSFASSLQTLTFYDCKNLRRLPRLDHFIVLEKLEFEYNLELSICEEEDGEEPLKTLPQSISQLKFFDLPKMKSLPKGFQHLTSLQSLTIEYCSGIKSLPQAIKKLSSLNKLLIRGCPDLEKRCQKSNGEDFPKIQHIQEITIVSYSLTFNINNILLYYFLSFH